jgi:hypothetical protein
MLSIASSNSRFEAAYLVINRDGSFSIGGLF